MSATAGSTTIEMPRLLRDRLRLLKAHARQPYHEVIAAALDRMPPGGMPERAPAPAGLDPLVARNAPRLRRLAAQNRIARLWLFGSRARGTARPDSDVDLLYELEPGGNLWDVSGFLADARDVLGVPVDLADRAGLSPSKRATLLAEAVEL